MGTMSEEILSGHVGKKVKAGASFVINQIGWDTRKDDPVGALELIGCR